MNNNSWLVFSLIILIIKMIKRNRQIVCLIIPNITLLGYYLTLFRNKALTESDWWLDII